MDNSLQKGAPVPKSLGLVVDEIKRVEEIAKAMQKETDAVKARVTELKDYFIENVAKSDDTGVAGKKYLGQVKTSVVPTAEDWPKIYDFIKKNDRFDLLSKALSAKGIKEMWEEGENVPGVGRFNKISVSITKIK